MACLSLERTKERFTSEHSVDSRSNLEREDKHIVARLLPTELATLCFTHCTDRFPFTIG